MGESAQGALELGPAGSTCSPLAQEPHHVSVYGNGIQQGLFIKILLGYFHVTDTPDSTLWGLFDSETAFSLPTPQLPF